MEEPPVNIEYIIYSETDNCLYYIIPYSMVGFFTTPDDIEELNGFLFHFKNNIEEQNKELSLIKGHKKLPKLLQRNKETFNKFYKFDKTFMDNNNDEFSDFEIETCNKYFKIIDRKNKIRKICQNLD